MNRIATVATERTATITDIVKRLTGSTYQSTAVDALGWGMGPAQLGIDAAVADAESSGYVIVSEVRGKKMVSLAPLFTLVYETKDGVKRREASPARAVETVGRVVMRMADREAAGNIQVFDAQGNDVTFDFACFRD